MWAETGEQVWPSWGVLSTQGPRGFRSEQRQKAPDRASGSSSAEGLPAPPPQAQPPPKARESPPQAREGHSVPQRSPCTYVYRPLLPVHVTGDAVRTRARTSSHAHPLGLQQPLPASQPSIQVPHLWVAYRHASIWARKFSTGSWEAVTAPALTPWVLTPLTSIHCMPCITSIPLITSSTTTPAPPTDTYAAGARTGTQYLSGPHGGRAGAGRAIEGSCWEPGLLRPGLRWWEGLWWGMDRNGENMIKKGVNNLPMEKETYGKYIKKMTLSNN